MSPIVPMPAFTNPSNPKTAGGSVNFGIAANFPDEHPVKHSDDYGQVVPRPEIDLREEDDREGWTKAQWVELAEAYGLDTRGNKDELIAAVEAHEAQLDGEEN